MAMFEVAMRHRDGAKPKQLRQQGLLPMALVERSHETMLLQASADHLREAMRHLDGHGAMELHIDGEGGTRRAIVRHIEHDALRHELIHVTLQEVADDDQIKTEVPIILTGSPTDEGSDSSLTQVLTALRVKARLRDLPDRIEVDITNLPVGGHLSVGDLALPEGVELLTPIDATVVTLNINREIEEVVGEEPELPLVETA